MLWLDLPQPVNLDLNKKLDPKQKTLAFNIDAEGLRKTRN